MQYQTMFRDGIKSDFIRSFFPENKKEQLILLGFFVFYSAIALNFAIFSPLLDHPTLETDTYFSFDNGLIYRYGRTQMTGHPITVLFYYPFVLLGNFLALIFTLKAKTIMFALLSSTMMSLSCLYINRYIREIVELDNKASLVFTLFFAFCSTNLILCFTPETFSLASFFLSYSVYYYSSFVKSGKKMSVWPCIILSTICLGGVTVTNFAKGVIPILFLNEKKSEIFKKLVLVGASFLGLLVFLYIALYLLDGRDYFKLMISHRDTFTAHNMPESNFDYFKYIFSRFWGASIFFPEIINHTYYSYSRETILSFIDVIDYQYWWQYLYSISLTILVIYSFLKNYKNKFSLMLLLLLSVDLIIHCILKFGMDSPFIYGGHWVYTIPLILAWLYKSFSNKPHTQNKIIVLFYALTIILLINNFIRLLQFIDIEKALYIL